ncbi:Crustacean hyperglycemic hormone [Chionoecetes opilio]|uniref:Crustacean hyperglycemic hormone n=1 Tax=Chionoecetes opilio TaxID=41210 RepID=A0A8J4XN17_CHIOP|nr:Crustacean hyperglycemic hormone [Chionoecetes opilio]
MTAAAWVVVVVVITCMAVGVQAGPVKSQRPQSTDSIEAVELRRHKRSAYVDSSCQGLYSRRVWDDLAYVCEDCANVFRKDGFQAKCRKGCFASDTFAHCLIVLDKDVNVYQAMATSLRGS